MTPPAHADRDPVLIVLHQRQSRPGRVGHLLREMGYRLDIRRPCLGQALPDSMAHHAGAVVFGGPQSANDDCTHDYIKQELDWIPRAVESGKPYLGLCLGGQMLARALGGRVFLHPEGKAEIGYYKLTPTASGRDIFEGLDHVYHWHREGFEAPAGTEILAEGAIFRHQAFRHGRHAYGLQFHCEVTNAMRRRWLRLAAHRLSMPGAQPRAAQLEDQRRFEGAIRRWARRFLAKWISGG